MLGPEHPAGMVHLRPSRRVAYAVAPARTHGSRLRVRETGPAEAPKPRLLDRVRQAIATRHYSRRTKKAYVHWIKRCVFFHGKRHPVEMGAAEVSAFLTSLAVDSKVAASTQNQALSAPCSFSIARCSAWSCRGSTRWSGPSGLCICPRC